MANVRLPDATRTALTTAFLAQLDAGATGALIRIYDSTGTGQPASANTAVTTQVKLAELTCSVTAGVSGSPSPGVLTFSPITQDVSANATGTATWARIVDSTGATVFDCDVATAGATITIDNASIVVGVPVSMSAFTITMPAS